MTVAVDLRAAPSGPRTGETAFAGVSCIVAAVGGGRSVADTVAGLSAALESELAERSIIGDFEVIIVGDAGGSALPAGALHVPAPQAAGVGAALHAGLQAARFDLVLFVEGAGEFDYVQVRELLAEIDQCDVVAGYRTARQEPLIRRANTFGWNALVRLLFGRLARDIDCAFKLFRAPALAGIELHHIRGRHAIVNTELLVRLRQRGARIREVAVRHVPRELGARVGASPLVIARALRELAGLALRIAVEQLGWFGFVTGLFSRSARPMEVVAFRRSEMLLPGAQVRCRLCAAEAYAVRRTRLRTCEDLRHLGQFDLYYCTACRNGFTHPLPPPAARVLAPDVPQAQYSPVQRGLLRWFISTRVEHVAAALGDRAGARILDIGGGSCAFANALARRGFAVTVVEPNPANAAFADPAVRFIAGEFGEARARGELQPGSFDAVTLWHSLEHLPDPVAAARECRALLRPGGCLYLSVPNLNSLQADLGGNYWTYLDIPHHLTHFSLDGLVELLRLLDFERFNVHWFSPEYEIFGFYQTLLNLLSRSHNYFYNRTKKGRAAAADLRHPRWAKLVTAFGWLLLPPALVLAAWADAAGKPATIELHCYRP